MDQNSDLSQHDLGTEELLREARIEPSPMELDRAFSTARRRAGASRRGRTPLRARVAIVAIFALGLVTSGAGTTLAFQGPSGSGDASSAQYNPNPPDKDPGGDKLGTTDNSGPNEPTSQATATAGKGEIPFTGLAAIPIVGIGLALLGGGLVLQRRVGRSSL